MQVRRLMGGALLAVMLLAGCGGGRSEGRQSEPTLEVTAAQEGRNLTVKVKTERYQIGKDGHVHIYINDGPEAMLYSDSYTVENIEPGHYKIRVELANMRHENIGVSKIVEVEVTP